LLDCTSSAPIDFTSAADGSPDFALPDGDNGLRLTWDVVAGSPDNDRVHHLRGASSYHASGGMLRLVTSAAPATTTTGFFPIGSCRWAVVIQPANLPSIATPAARRAPSTRATSRSAYRRDAGVVRAGLPRHGCRDDRAQFCTRQQ
jgi:hypothetical protein